MVPQGDCAGAHATGRLCRGSCNRETMERLMRQGDCAGFMQQGDCAGARATGRSLLQQIFVAKKVLSRQAYFRCDKRCVLFLNLL